jgi:hypothetical protein
MRWAPFLGHMYNIPTQMSETKLVILQDAQAKPQTLSLSITPYFTRVFLYTKPPI